MFLISAGNLCSGVKCKYNEYCVNGACKCKDNYVLQNGLCVGEKSQRFILPGFKPACDMPLRIIILWNILQDQKLAGTAVRKLTCVGFTCGRRGVCVVSDGKRRCECKAGYYRGTDGRCMETMKKGVHTIYFPSIFCYPSIGYMCLYFQFFEDFCRVVCKHLHLQFDILLLTSWLKNLLFCFQIMSVM